MGTPSTGREPAVLRFARMAPLGLGILGAQAPITALLTLATALALFDLGDKSLWLDEAASVEFASMGWAGLLDFWWNREIAMGPYYAALKLWMGVFGTSEAAVRSLSVLPAVGAVWATWRIGLRLFDHQTAMAAALILAVNGTFIALAQEARAYAMVLFFTTLATLAFLQAVERAGLKNWILYTLLMVVAVYLHVLAALLVPAHMIPMLLLRRWEARWRPMVGSAVLGAVMLAPIGAFIVRIDTPYPTWIPPRDFGDLPQLFFFLASYNYWLLGVYGVAAWTGLLWASQVTGEPTPSRRLWPFLLVVSMLVVPLLLATSISIAYVPLLVNRYLLFSLPALALLVGLGITRTRPHLLAAALLALVVVLSAFTLKTYYDAAKEDWRAVAQHIAAEAQPSDAALLHAGFIYAPYAYYMQRQTAGSKPNITLQVWDGTDVSSLVKGISSAHETVWLVLSHDDGSPVSARLQRMLAERYREIDRVAFAEGIRLVEYRRR